MHLKRFNEFVHELAEDSSLKSSVSAIEVARRFEDVWYREDGSKIEDDALIADLELTLLIDEPWRRTNDTRVLFPLYALKGVGIGVFKTKPTAATRKRIHEKILSCLKRSSDSYRARHDSLTELLNRPALDATLLEKIKQSQSTISVADEAQDGQGTQFTSIVYLMLDIDFFKRVNDNYGHTYGDLVLKCFAIRLQRTCELIELNKRYAAEIHCARPSGEEFAVLVTGFVRPDAELEIAEALRDAIVSRPLPDESELGVLNSESKLQGVGLPPVTERHITPSVGLSSRHFEAGSGSPDALAERLKVEADLALNRAKVLGRNRCVRFCDIVQRHGQVIEHHTDVDVVAIDLGQQVGASLGQEFLVFHPDFIGSKPFLFGDGRSERKLGCYPRVPHGRLEVFDVQSEISFCYVADKRGIERFPTGALLEAVPVGSIAHLVSKDWWRWKDHHKLAPGREDVERELLKVDPWDVAGLACLRLCNKDKLLSFRGAGFVNRVYASLYTELREAFKRDLVAQLDTDTFTAVVRYGTDDLEKRLQSISEAVGEAFDSLPIVSVGLFVQTLDDREDELGLSFKHGLRYANAALELAVRRQAKLIKFSPDTVGELFTVFRMNKEYEVLEEFYKEFRDIGFRSGQMEGEMAIAAFLTQDYPKAREAIDRAIEIEPGRASFKRNKGVFLVATGEALAAAEIFDMIPAEEEEPEAYKAARTMANLHKYEQDPASIDRGDLIEALRALQTKRNLLRFINIRPFDVTLALERLRSQPEPARAC